MINTDIQITTDSVCDLPPQIYSKYNIHVIYSRIVTDYGDFYDSKEITSTNLIEYYATQQNRVTTLCPSVQEYNDFFARESETSCRILHIAVSSDISDSYLNAKKAAQTNEKVYIFDSKQLSGGIGILVLIAASLAKDGKTIDEIIKKLEYYRECIYSASVIRSMKYFQPDHFRKNFTLRKYITRILNNRFIHPSFFIKGGSLEMKKLYLGSIEKYSKKFVRNELRKHDKTDNSIIIIAYADCPYEILDAIRIEISRYIHFEHILSTPMAAVTTSHCGPNTIALFYITVN